MNSFKYFPAETVKEACDLLAQYGEEAKILGGGQSLITFMKQEFVSPSYIIDIKGITDLDYLRYDKADGLRIGALTTHRTLELSAVVREKYLMLAEMELTLASVPVRNWGTVGGNLAHADPASDLAPALLAFGAEVTLTGASAERVVSLDKFFLDYFETAIEHDEILTEIHLPNSERGGGYYYKFAQRPTDLAIASVAVYLVFQADNSDSCKNIRIAMGSVGATTLRSKRAEEVLKRQTLNDEGIKEAARISAEDAQPTTDINGSEEYKREIIQVLVERAIKEASARASVS